MKACRVPHRKAATSRISIFFSTLAAEHVAAARFQSEGCSRRKEYAREQKAFHSYIWRDQTGDRFEAGRDERGERAPSNQQPRSDSSSSSFLSV